MHAFNILLGPHYNTSRKITFISVFFPLKHAVFLELPGGGESVQSRIVAGDFDSVVPG